MSIFLSRSILGVLIAIGLIVVLVSFSMYQPFTDTNDMPVALNDIELLDNMDVSSSQTPLSLPVAAVAADSFSGKSSSSANFILNKPARTQTGDGAESEQESKQKSQLKPTIPVQVKPNSITAQKSNISRRNVYNEVQQQRDTEDCTQISITDFPNTAHVLSFSFEEDKSFAAKLIGDHTYELEHHRVNLPGCNVNTSRSKATYNRCACHYQATYEGCLRSFEKSHQHCSEEVPWVAETFVYHPLPGTSGFPGAFNDKWRGQCCMVHEFSTKWPPIHSGTHVTGFVASDSWKGHLYTLNGKAIKDHVENTKTKFISLKSAICGPRPDQNPCGFLRQPGKSYTSHKKGVMTMGGNLEVFPLTPSEYECARLCCLLGAACTTYTWFAPRHMYSQRDLAYRCTYSAEGEKWHNKAVREELRGALSGLKKTTPIRQTFLRSLSEDQDDSVWDTFENTATTVESTMYPCDHGPPLKETLYKPKHAKEDDVPCTSVYDCSVVGNGSVESSPNARWLWKDAKSFPAAGQCIGVSGKSGGMQQGRCQCGPSEIFHVNPKTGICELRPGRCRTDEHCSPPGALVRGYCFNEAGKMSNANPRDPEYGICYCLNDSVMQKAADGTVYCMDSFSTNKDVLDLKTEFNCRDSSGKAVRGPRLASGLKEVARGGMKEPHTPRVCVFVGTAFEDSVSKKIMRGGSSVELQFNFSARRLAIQETWGNENTFLVWSKHLETKPDVGPYQRWKYKAIDVDIAVDLPYERVAHRFFKVPEFLAEDYKAQGETSSCDWMIMTDDDAYINIPEWENLFKNTQWINPADIWHLGPVQGIGFHKGSVPFLHGTSIGFSRGAISAFGEWAEDCYRYFDSPTGHTEHWGDTALGKCMLLHGIQGKMLSSMFFIDNKHPDAGVKKVGNRGGVTDACLLSAHKFTVEGTYEFHNKLKKINEDFQTKQSKKHEGDEVALAAMLRCELRSKAQFNPGQCVTSHGYGIKK